MCNRQQVVKAGGSLQRSASSVASVDFWYIPGGANYDAAVIVVGYFDDMDAAKAFYEQNRMPPEMAHLKELDPAEFELELEDQKRWE